MTLQDQAEIPEWLDVSRETFAGLSSFVELLEKWNPAINLVSKASLSQVWQRHVFDSAQLLPLVPVTAKRWVDLGSGGGFPGLIVAIIARESHPGLKVSLVESDQRKAIFLSEVCRQLNLSAEVMASRIETLPPQAADVLSARALSPLAELCAHSARHVAPGGVSLFPKGAKVDTEIAEARLNWRFQAVHHASKTDSGATILAVRDVVHV